MTPEQWDKRPKATVILDDTLAKHFDPLSEKCFIIEEVLGALKNSITIIFDEDGRFEIREIKETKAL